MIIIRLFFIGLNAQIVSNYILIIINSNSNKDVLINLYDFHIN